MILSEELKSIVRSMITASHYGNLPDEEFDKYLQSIVKATANEIRKRIEEKFSCQCDATNDGEFSPYRICIDRLTEWQSLWKDILGES